MFICLLVLFSDPPNLRILGGIKPPQCNAPHPTLSLTRTLKNNNDNKSNLIFKKIMILRKLRSVTSAIHQVLFCCLTVKNLLCIFTRQEKIVTYWSVKSLIPKRKIGISEEKCCKYVAQSWNMVSCKAIELARIN